MSNVSSSGLKSAMIAALVGCAVPAVADEFEAKLVACAADKIVIAGVPSCRKIWKLESGEAEIEEGKLEVEVRGLLLDDPSVGAENGTRDSVDGVAAAVVCHGPSGAVVVAQTAAVPLSETGDAKIEASLSLPHGCVGPVVLLREHYKGKLRRWIAVTGQ